MFPEMLINMLAGGGFFSLHISIVKYFYLVGNKKSVVICYFFSKKRFTLIVLTKNTSLT